MSVACRPFLLLLALALGPPARAGEGGSEARAAAVLARAQTAAGGVERLASLSALRMRARIESGGLVGEMDVAYGPGEWYAERARHGPIESGVGIGPEGSWIQERGSVSSPAPEAARAARRDAAFYDTYRYLLPGAARAEDVGPGGPDLEPCRWVRLVPREASPRELCFRDSDGLPAAARYVPADGGAEVGVRFSDYRAVSGVTLPFRIAVEPRRTQRNAVVLTVVGWEVDAAPDPRAFDPPRDPHRPLYARENAARGIPLRFDGSHLLIEGRLGGQGPLTFLLDTGSSASVVDRGVARALGLVPEGDLEAWGPGGPTRNQLVRLPPLDLPGVRLTGETWAVLDVSNPVAGGLGIEVHGVIGADLLRRFVVEVDPARRRLSLHDPETYEHRGAGTPLPLEWIGRRPVVRVSVDGGKEVPFVVDTGSDAIVVPADGEAGARLLSEHGPGVGVAASGVGGPLRLRAVRAREISAWPFRLASPVVHVRDASTDGGAEDVGLLGMPFLGRFTCTLDLRRAQVWLEPNFRYADPQAYDETGLSLGREEGAWRVHSTSRGSPADLAGLPVGAELTAIQGLPAPGLSRGRIQALLAGASGGQVVIEYDHRGRKRRTLLEVAATEAEPPRGAPPPDGR